MVPREQIGTAMGIYRIDRQAVAGLDQRAGLIEIAGTTPRNVKRWPDGQIALRWCAAGMIEACRQYRRVYGHLHLRALRPALERPVATRTVGMTRHTDTVNAAQTRSSTPSMGGNPGCNGASAIVAAVKSWAGDVIMGLVGWGGLADGG
jgi:hypothetical protein